MWWPEPPRPREPEFSPAGHSLAEKLRILIRNGTLRPWTTLRPDELAQEYRVSADVAEEALNSLFLQTHR